MAEKRATAADFIRLGVGLAMLRRLHGHRGATLVRGDCPTCGADIPMLSVRDVRAGRVKISCTNCPYSATEITDTGG